MLLCYFTPATESASRSRILSYCDRIWLEPDLTATIHRTFILEVLPESKAPLSEIRMLLPFASSAVTNLKGLNDTAFNADWYFNSPALRASREYGITKKLTSDRESFGIIDDDGIKDIKVFRGNLAVPSQFALKNSTVIVFRFENRLEPGEKTQYRLSFDISGFGKRSETQLANYYELRYFDSPKFREEVAFQPADNLVPFYLVPGQTAGGFSVLLYSPPGFDRVQGFDHAEESRDPIGPDTKEARERTKCVWQLSDIWDLQQPTEVKLEREFSLRGTFGRRIDTDLLGGLEKLKKRVDEQKKEIRFATIVAIVGAIIAFIALLPFLPDVWRWLRQIPLH